MIRPLDEYEVTAQYLSWFEESAAARFIQSAKRKQTLAGLQAYVRQKRESDNALLLGIFTDVKRLHIGNIKFEPISVHLGAAVVGVLIGDPAWRGKGVFREVFLAVADVLHEQSGIDIYWLGVEKENQSAIKAYQGTGFVEGVPPLEIIPNPHEQCLYYFYNI